MNYSGIIKSLNEIKKQIGIFKQIARKYPLSHKYYKERLKSLKLKIREFLLRLQKLYGKLKIPEEICALLNSFLALEKPTNKNCDEIIDNLDLKFQEWKLSIEETTDSFEERIYDKNSRFDFRINIKEIFSKADTELFIIDSWIDEDLLETYLKDIKRDLKIKVLSGKNPKGKISKLINDYNNQHNNCLEVRESSEIHDRGIFINNQEGWVMGQSIKDGAKNKPTYLIKLKDAKKLESIYQRIWNSATKIK